MPQPAKSLITAGYRKPTHTDLYLQWNSHHNLAAKYSVITTLTHIPKSVCSNPQLLNEEEDSLRRALRRCKYPGLALNWANIKSNRSNRSYNIRINTTNNYNKPHIMVPYIKGLSESCKKCAANMANKCISKEAVPTRTFLLNPRKQISSGRKVGWYTDTSMAEWTVKMNILRSQAEHLLKDTKNTLKAPSPIHDHHNNTGHDISINNFSIVGRGDHNLARSIIDAILIRVNGPYLNRNIGKYQLPHIWDGVLMN